jgi:acetyl-CoA carboxylase carboxyltransferase component
MYNHFQFRRHKCLEEHHVLVFPFSVSGCTDYFAADEYEGFQTGRDLVETLNLHDHPGPSRVPEDPLYDPEHIQGLIPSGNSENMDIRKV